MGRYKNRIVLVVFIVLLGVAYILRNPEVLPTSKGSQALFPGFNKQAIDKIEIQKGQPESNVLVKKDDKWVVENENNFPADAELVENVLATTAKLQKEELVGKSKANHAKFGVDRENKGNQPRTTQGQYHVGYTPLGAGFGNQGVRVELLGGGNKYELIVGGRGPGFSSTYFRRTDEDEVYLADQDLDFVFGESEWRDLKLKVKSEKLKVINIINENGATELQKTEDKWILTKPEKKDDIVQSRVEDLVSRLTTLEAADATVSAELDETGFDNPAVTVKIAGEKDEDELIIGKKKDTQRYAQISGSPYIYILSPSAYGMLEELGRDYFLDEPAEE